MVNKIILFVGFRAITPIATLWIRPWSTSAAVGESEHQFWAWLQKIWAFVLSSYRAPVSTGPGCKVPSEPPLRDAGERWSDGGIASCSFKKGQRGNGGGAGAGASHSSALREIHFQRSLIAWQHHSVQSSVARPFCKINILFAHLLPVCPRQSPFQHALTSMWLFPCTSGR